MLQKLFFTKSNIDSHFHRQVHLRGVLEKTANQSRSIKKLLYRVRLKLLTKFQDRRKKNQKSRLRQVFNFTRKIPTKRCDSLGKKTRPEINDHVKLGRFHRLLTY